MDMAWGGRAEGEGEMYGQSNTVTYITICKIDSQWKLAVWLWELKSGLSDHPEGRDEGEVGGMFKWEETWVDLFMLMLDRNQHNTVKQ